LPVSIVIGGGESHFIILTSGDAGDGAGAGAGAGVGEGAGSEPPQEAINSPATTKVVISSQENAFIFIDLLLPESVNYLKILAY
jgi:hypothetical protein